MALRKPKYGYCQLCQGPIKEGQHWTLTALLYRTHNEPDDCIWHLHTRQNRNISCETGRSSKISNFWRDERESDLAILDRNRHDKK